MALVIVIAIGLAGCSETPSASPAPPQPNLRVQFLEDNLETPLGNVAVVAILVQCDALDDLATVVSFGWAECPRVRLNGTTDDNGWWNTTYDVDAGHLEHLYLRADGRAGRAFDAPQFPLTFRGLLATKSQGANLTADPGVWVGAATQVTPQQEKAVPFTVDPDPAVNQAYLDELATFRVRVEWTNEPAAMAMLSAAYGNNGRIIGSSGPILQEPYPSGPQANEASRSSAYKETWAGFVFGFQAGWPVIAQQPIPVFVLAEYTFDDAEP